MGVKERKGVRVAGRLIKAGMAGLKPFWKEHGGFGKGADGKMGVCWCVGVGKAELGVQWNEAGLNACPPGYDALRLQPSREEGLVTLFVPKESSRRSFSSSSLVSFSKSMSPNVSFSSFFCASDSGKTMRSFSCRLVDVCVVALGAEAGSVCLFSR